MESGEICESNCFHDRTAVRRACDYVNNRVEGGGGVTVKSEIVYDEKTHIASRSGYYIMGGGIVYMHSDGSLCRMLEREQQCSCGCVHVR
mgnify:CR=1 FL=1